MKKFAIVGSCGLQLAENPDILGFSRARLARIVPTLKPYIDRRELPCALTAIARHGKVVHFETQGYADVDKQQLLQPDTLFRIYSMTKPVTGVAVMMLYEEGYFHLDEPIANYLPEFATMQVWTDKGLVDAEHPITIRHLLTHTSGLTYSTVHQDPNKAKIFSAGTHGALSRLSGVNLEQHVKNLAGVPLIAQPGSAWNYGESMNVLARLVEVLSGKTYSNFLRERLFTPLEMSDTDHFVPPEKADRLARLYVPGPDGRTVPAGVDDYGGDYLQKPSLEAGGAGLVGTAGDFLRFSQMLLNGGELEGERILSATTVRLMMSNHLGPDFGDRPLASLDYSLTQRRGMGFGLSGFVVTNAVASGTAGSDGEFSWGGWASTHFWIDPKLKLIGLVLSQLLPVGLYPIPEKMHQMTYQAIVEE